MPSLQDVFPEKREKSTGKIQLEFRSKFSSKSPDSSVWIAGWIAARRNEVHYASSSALSDELRKKKPFLWFLDQGRKIVWGSLRFLPDEETTMTSGVLRDTETGIRSNLTLWSLTALRQVHPDSRRRSFGLRLIRCYIDPSCHAYRFTRTVCTLDVL